MKPFDEVWHETNVIGEYIKIIPVNRKSEMVYQYFRLRYNRYGMLQP